LLECLATYGENQQREPHDSQCKESSNHDVPMIPKIRFGQTKKGPVAQPADASQGRKTASGLIPRDILCSLARAGDRPTSQKRPSELAATKITAKDYTLHTPRKKQGL
jgi:hypothetical protein